MDHHINIIKDIIFPYINFLGFAGILFYFLRKPVVHMFQSRSVDLEKKIGEATAAYEEAKKGFDRIKERLDGIEKEKKELKTWSDQEIEKVKKNSKQELEELLVRTKEEHTNRIQDAVRQAQQVLIKEISQKVIQDAEELCKKDLGKKDQQRLVEGYLASSFSDGKVTLKGVSSNESKERGAIRSGTR